MRILPGAAALALAWLPAAAQDTELEAACRARVGDPGARIEACSRLIDSGAYSDQPWVFFRRGDAYGDADDHEAAVADHSRALEIDPDDQRALGGRVYSLLQLRRYEEMLADTADLIRVDPDDAWNYYMRGNALDRLGRDEEALAAYGRAIGLDDAYYWPRMRRGALLLRLDRIDEAVRDLEAAKSILPFATAPYEYLGNHYEDGGDPAAAARNYGILFMLRPDRTDIEARLNRLMPRPEPPALAPLDYRPPPEGLALQYLQVILPYDTRDEMEKAILALGDWFAAPPAAMPEATLFVTRRLSAEGDVVGIGLTVDAARNLEAFAPGTGRLPDRVETFRGFFPTDIRPAGDQGPHFRLAYDGGEPADLWPLEVGRAVSGAGRYLAVCPEGFHLPSMMLGCRIGMDSVEIGTVEYSLAVEATESVRVPLGRFDSFVVRYRERARLTMGGQEQLREQETKWWLAPEFGFWVRRTSLIGDRIAVMEAVARPAE